MTKINKRKNERKEKKERKEKRSILTSLAFCIWSKTCLAVVSGSRNSKGSVSFYSCSDRFTAFSKMLPQREHARCKLPLQKKHSVAGIMKMPLIIIRIIITIQARHFHYSN